MFFTFHSSEVRVRSPTLKFQCTFDLPLISVKREVLSYNELHILDVSSISDITCHLYSLRETKTTLDRREE